MRLQNGQQLNSLETATPLAGSGTWTSDWVDVSLYGEIVFACLSSASGTLYAQFSATGSESAGGTPPSTITYSIAAGVNDVHRLVRTRRFFRLRYVNGSTPQTSFHIQTFAGSAGILTSSLSGSVQQDHDAVITRSIPSNIEISAGRFTGHRVEDKFGYYASVGTALTDIWNTGGVRGWGTSAESLEVLSSSTNDTAAGNGARQVTIYGLDANWEEQETVVTLNGTSAVSVATTFIRTHRALVTQRGSYSSANDGTITIRIASGGATRLQIPVDGTAGGLGRSQSSHYTIPAGKTGHAVQFIFDVESTKAVNIIPRIRTNSDDVSAPYAGILDAPVIFSGITSLQPISLPYPYVLPEKTDLWFQAYAIGATTGFVSVAYQVVLVNN